MTCAAAVFFSSQQQTKPLESVLRAVSVFLSEIFGPQAHAINVVNLSRARSS